MVGYPGYLQLPLSFTDRTAGPPPVVPAGLTTVPSAELSASLRGRKTFLLLAYCFCESVHFLFVMVRLLTSILKLLSASHSMYPFTRALEISTDSP
jgi:hypothetical protein